MFNTTGTTNELLGSKKCFNNSNIQKRTYIPNGLMNQINVSSRTDPKSNIFYSYLIFKSSTVGCTNCIKKSMIDGDELSFWLRQVVGSNNILMFGPDSQPDFS